MGVYYFSSDYVYENGKWESKSIFVKDNKFTITFNNKTNAREMNVEHFWIGPGKVYVDFEEPVYKNEGYEHIIQKYIFRGCTLLLCQLPFQTSYKYKQRFNSFRNTLSKKLPIDFMIVPRIPATKLTAELIKFFGKEKVPFILIDANEKSELKKVKWAWIQQAQNFSRTPIIPMIEKNSKRMKEWVKICNKYRIETFSEVINEFPLTRDVLRLTGISPHKGEFLHQGCADYNFFDLSSMPEIDEQANFRYHEAIPVLTVSNGNVVKSNQLVHSDTKKGNYTMVTIPRHFV